MLIRPQESISLVSTNKGDGVFGVLTLDLMRDPFFLIGSSLFINFIPQ